MTITRALTAGVSAKENRWRSIARPRGLSKVSGVVVSAPGLTVSMRGHQRRAQIDLAAAIAQPQRRAQVGGGLGRGGLGGRRAHGRLRGRERHRAAEPPPLAERGRERGPQGRRVDGQAAACRPHADRVADERQPGVVRRRFGDRRDLLQLRLKGARVEAHHRRHLAAAAEPGPQAGHVGAAAQGGQPRRGRDVDSQAEIGQRYRQRSLAGLQHDAAELTGGELMGDGGPCLRGAIAGQAHAAGTHAERHAPVQIALQDEKGGRDDDERHAERDRRRAAPAARVRGAGDRRRLDDVVQGRSARCHHFTPGGVPRAAGVPLHEGAHAVVIGHRAKALTDRVREGGARRRAALVRRSTPSSPLRQA